MDEVGFEAVAAALGHSFREPALLRRALTHRSYVNETEGRRQDNERLEFLGDAVLGLIVASLLWERFPDAPEGELTRRRAELVCEPTLAALAETLAIPQGLRLGRGEEQTGGRHKPRLLASALEASVGALYLDGGFAAADACCRRLFAARVDATTGAISDPKSRVQERLQADHGLTPRYEVIRTEGPDHERRFFVELKIADRTVSTGSGRSKSAAEQSAAAQALRALDGQRGG